MNGIYLIKNKTDNKYYIGSSRFPEKRLYDHKILLESHSHYNKEMQNDFNKLGIDCFSFEIMCDNLEKDDLKGNEQKYIEQYESTKKENGYNKNNAKGKKLYKKNTNENYKNVKISWDAHNEIKAISIETGINVSKLIEIIARKIIEDYKAGKIDSIINSHRQMRRDGTIVRSSS
jgi:group I intron endonuclease